MELYKINLYVRNLTKNMQEIKFISTGLGTEYAGKLYVFMERKIRKSDKQKRKKYKAVSCQKKNSSENFKTPL